MTSSRSLLLLMAAVATAAALPQAGASPLDPETCNKMMAEQGALEAAGVEQTMAKGPEWAKANLSPEKIEQVRRFIELEEMILFRCRSKARVVLPPDPEDEKDKQPPAQDEAKDKGQGTVAAEKATAPDKNETVVPKTLSKSQPPKAGTAAPSGKADAKSDKGKADAKKQKAKGGTQAGKKEGSKAKAEAKGDRKAQHKTAAGKQDSAGAKTQTKAKATPQPPKTGAKGAAKVKEEAQPKATPQPPKTGAKSAAQVKEEAQPKADVPPGPSSFGDTFPDPAK